MSTTTSAAASITSKSSLKLSEGVIDQATDIFKAARLESCIGRRSEFKLILGKEWTKNGLLLQFHVALNTVPSLETCDQTSVPASYLVKERGTYRDALGA